MRQRIVRVTIAAVTVALLLFAVPLGVAIQVVVFGQERLELERSALRAGARVGPDVMHGDPVELPVETRRSVAIYDPTLRRRAGAGPDLGDDAVARAARGTITELSVDHTLVIAVPVTSSEKVIAVVRASIPTQAVWARVVLTWLVLAALAAAALGAAVAVARRQARVLSEPLESLAAVSERISAGDLAARIGPSRIPEVQRVAETQNTMLNGLVSALDRERTFSTHVSHQLRTPLTGMQLALDHAVEQSDVGDDASTALHDALRRSEQLRRTIDDLLQAAHTGPDTWLISPRLSVAAILAVTERSWHGPLAELGRHLATRFDDAASDSTVPERAVTQILDVLLDNAMRHGRGAVVVDVRPMAGAVALHVSDEGHLDDGADPFVGAAQRPGHGIGLPLARSIAHACGGRLRLATRQPTEFVLILPE